MKRGILLIGLIGFLTGCCKDDEVDCSKGPELVGTWKLTETLVDPGDGSGTFQSVSSSKTIKFYSNGNVTSNGSICEMSISSNLNSSGTYSEADETINPSACPNTEIKYEMNGNILILKYPCFEACSAKYVKI